MNPSVWACSCAPQCPPDLLFQLPASATPSGTSTVSLLQPFGRTRALPDLSAETSPNEASVSVTVPGDELPDDNYQSGGLPGLGLCT